MKKKSIVVFGATGTLGSHFSIHFKREMEKQQFIKKV